MRVNRAKQYRKFLRFYKIVYGVSAPYHIILDGNFIYAAVKFKVDIEERIRKVLQGESVTLYVTKSTLNELSSLGTKTKLALEFAQRHCIELNDMSFPGEVASEKLVAFLVDSSHERKGSQRKYVVASQDRELRISVVFRKKNDSFDSQLSVVTLVLEPPAGKSRDVNMQLEDAKSAVTPDEIEVLKIIKEHGTAEEANSESATTERRKRKATAPNPLSTRKADEHSKSTKRKKVEKYSRGRK